ncbi:MULTISPECIES: tRNA lysidine(34) synthetase TilS [unclassified Dysgonomonas]|jgi:tRNA(Ile)-lysidine synthase|uniref:tRNA lysidine(34) synthetase TilS n=1 Tax=unclassified Dysgonomonas TaxID=2630389 RepID=UPI0025C32370|nr:MULTISPECIES: tRNA lysidine(34) synthetase TilS [unclassified Dysgonomonas]MDR2004330.1 tRNA lysidine(34) synthetase TilS [Prevotella sp.]HMM04636.1 tRNA lysidine(34) synthetase TilS [Dysgonomonas sp.]
MDISRVEQYIVANGLLAGGEKIIVGVSGGADSVALLDILHSFGLECVVAHCNFHLRGEESNRDAFFVEELCKKYNLKYERIDFDTEAYAAINSVSIEMAARELRYNWFEQLRVIHMADKIAVAHHRDDSVETILLNLVRGTGIRGLTGIAPVNGYVIRPLLSLSRDEIVEYLKDRRLSFVDDSTNNEDMYARNKIRLNVIPVLEAINPSVKESVNKTAEHLTQVANIYYMYMAQVKANIFADNKINISMLVQYLEPEAILFELLSPYGFNSATVRQIFESVISQSGKIFYSETHELLKDRGYLILKKKDNLKIERYNIHEDESTLSRPIHLKIERTPVNGDFSIEKNPDIIYIDADKLAYPLTLRKWRQGDWFMPFGMKGKKKVSDYFSDNKFSLFDKEAAWLLCSGDDIVWIIGHRSDERFKITDKTTEVVKIIYSK